MADKPIKHTFTGMANWSLNQMRGLRENLRDELSQAIHKRNAIKCEIVFLQREIIRYQEEDEV